MKNLNDADENLYLASRNIKVANKLVTWRWVLVGIFLGLVIAGGLFIASSTIPFLMLLTTGWAFLDAFLLFIFSLLGCTFLLNTHNFFRNFGIRKIERAPKLAPADRKLEYEVRTLLMLQHSLPSWKLWKRLERIRRLGKLDPENPWPKKVEHIEKNIGAKRIQENNWQVFFLVGILLALLLSVM